MIRHALILTAGLGTRLRPLTDVRAKPAIPVAGEPMIRWIIRWLVSREVTDLVLNLHHRPETITSVVGDGSDLGARVRYSWEQPTVLGSAGGPKLAFPLVGADPMFIINGDTLTDVDLTALADTHHESGAVATLALVPNLHFERYGGVVLDADRRVTGFVWRGPSAKGSYHYIGVQVAHADAFSAVRTGDAARSIGGVYDAIIRERPGAIRGFIADAAFWDVGTVADYWQTTRAFAGQASRRSSDDRASVADRSHRQRHRLDPLGRCRGRCAGGDREMHPDGRGANTSRRDLSGHYPHAARRRAHRCSNGCRGQPACRPRADTWVRPYEYMTDQRTPDGQQTRERIDRFLRESGMIDRRARVVPLTGDASDRKYFRVITPDASSYVIALHAGPIDFTTLPFANVADLLRQVPLPVPQIFGHSDSLGIVALQDLGDVTLQAHLGAASPAEHAALYRQAVALIDQLQRRGAELESDQYLPYRVAFDVEKLTWELEYFVKHFVEGYRAAELSESERSALAAEWKTIVEELADEPRVLCHRDYHSRNLMLREGSLYIIDFQDARMGPDTYDLASLLRDSVRRYFRSGPRRSHRLFRSRSPDAGARRARSSSAAVSI